MHAKCFRVIWSDTGGGLLVVGMASPGEFIRDLLFLFIVRCIDPQPTAKSTNPTTVGWWRHQLPKIEDLTNATTTRSE